jgi:hypothetical protein
MNKNNFKIFELLQTKEHLIKPFIYDNFIYYLFSVKIYKPTFLKIEYILNNLHKTIMPFSKSNINKLYKNLKRLEKNEEKEEKDEENEEKEEKDEEKEVSFIDTLQDEIIINITKETGKTEIFEEDQHEFKIEDDKYNIKNVKNYEPMNIYNEEYRQGYTEYEIVRRNIENSNNKKFIKIIFTYNKADGTSSAEFKEEEVNFDLNSTFSWRSIFEKIRYNVTYGGSNFLSWAKAFLDDEEEGEGGSVDIKILFFNNIDTTGEQYKFIQTYRDNGSSGVCVYDGLIKFFEKYEKGEGRSVYNKLINNEEKYKKAYNIKELEEMAQSLKISITIKDLINNNNIKININEKNHYKIKFINTKLNHLDLYTCENISPDEVSYEEYNKIKLKSSFYIEKCGVLHTLNKCIKEIKTPFQVLFNSWKEDFKINSFSIDMNSDASKFINNYDDKVHRFFNKDIINNNLLYNEIDLKTAYYNYKGNRKTAKIPTGAYVCISKDSDGKYLNIKQFQEQINNNMVGFYEVEILEYNFKLDFLGFKKGTCHVLFTTQLEIIIKEVKLNILNYCISPSIEAPFNELFLLYGDNLTNEKNGVRAYAKAVGCLMIDNETITTNLKSNDDTINKIILLNKNQTLHKTNEKYEYKIIEESERPKSNRHVALSIHAYSSSIILENILYNFENIKDVVGVKVDAIVYKKDAILISNDLQLFKEPTQAKIKNMIDNSIAVYGPYFEPFKKDNKINFEESFIKEHIKSNKILISGKGGCGKTHTCMNTKNFNNNNIVFTSFCWNLIQQKEAEYPQILGLSTCKIIGSNGAQKFNIDNKKIIIADEITLNNKTDLIKMIKDNETKIIILLGDIDNNTFYQCSITENVISPKDIKNLQSITFTKNYRFDEELNNKLEVLRELMRKNATKEDLFNYVKTDFKNNFRKKDEFKFDKKYHVGITALKPVFIDNICTLSKEFIKSDNINDYKIFVKQTNIFNNQLRGRQHEYKEDGNYKNYECSIFSTIHSYQGQEIQKDTETEKYKIVININSLFNYQLLYTALSRARTCDQIIIIDDVKKNETKKTKNPELEKLKQENMEKTERVRKWQQKKDEKNGITEEIKAVQEALKANIQQEKINKIKQYIEYTKNNKIIKEEEQTKIKIYEDKKEINNDYDGLDYGL